MPIGGRKVGGAPSGVGNRTLRDSLTTTVFVREEAFALPAVIFVMMLLSALTLAALLTTGDDWRAGRAVRESAKAFYAAEAGANAVIAGWDQSAYDTLLPGPGDSLDLGWQTLDNGCSYRAVVRRVDDGLSFNKAYTAMVVGRGVGGLRGQRTLAVQMRTEMLTLGKAVVVGGDLEITGNINVLGECPGLHANGQISGGGTLTVQGEVTSADTILKAPGTIVDTLGNPVPTQSYVDSIAVTQLNPLEECDEAEYIVRNDWIVTVGPPADSLSLPPTDTVGTNVLGWSAEAGDYTGEFSNMLPGTFCVYGNVKASGTAGTSTDPFMLTIIATGSIEVTGKSYLKADHSEDINLLAGGDVKVEGKTSVDTGIEGLIYARSQCDFGGSTNITGQIVCLDEPDPAGAKNLTDTNLIRGGTGLDFGCGQLPAGFRARPVSQRAWSPLLY